VLTFTFLTLVATLLHIDKFHFGPTFSLFTQAGTWVWLLVYALVPVAMAVLLVLQLRQPGIDPPREAPMASWIRLVYLVQAAVMVLLGIALFVAPTPLASLIWPWQLTALTGRAIGAWLIGVGIAAGHMAWENDWLRARIGAISYTLFGALELVVVLRFATAQDPASGYPILGWGDPRTWVYLLFLISILGAGVFGWWSARQAGEGSA
jgi:hypothetical protein